VRELVYQPRIGNRNGIITDYEIAASADGATFATVAGGTWAADASRKTAGFSAPSARFIRLTALAGVGGFASAAEIVLFAAR
jgi:hexosaminidase